MYILLVSLFLSTANAQDTEDPTPPAEVSEDDDGGEDSSVPSQDGEHEVRPTPPPPDANHGNRRRGHEHQRNGPQSGDSISAERLQQLRTYRNRRLMIRHEVNVRGGGSTMTGTTFATGAGPMVTTHQIHSSPVYTTRTWAIYRGHERLRTPQFLELVGEESALATIESAIDRRNRQTRTRFTIAGIGGGGVVMGIMGLSVATNPELRYTWNLVTQAGALVGIGGLVSGSISRSRAWQLAHHPAHTLSVSEVQELIDAYNEALRQELRLTPREIWMIESGGRQ